MLYMSDCLRLYESVAKSINDFNAFREKLNSEVKAYGSFVTDKEKEEISAGYKSIAEKSDILRKLTIEESPKIHDLLDSLEKIDDNPDKALEDLVEARVSFNEFRERLSPYADLPREVSKFKKLTRKTFDKAQDKMLEEEIDELRRIAEAEKDPELKKMHEETISVLQDTQEIVKSLRIDLPDFSEFDISLNRLNRSLDVQITESNTTKISYILGNPNEFMARMVDSLYSLHFGDYEEDRFPLNERDLEFLGRFSSNGGKLFRKGIEKYTVGMEMRADGHSPEQIKSDLEYATKSQYRGKKLSWPEADFRFRGELPVHSFSTKEAKED